MSARPTVCKLNIGGTRVFVYSTAAALFRDAVSELFDTLKENPAAAIGLATGATFIPFYRLVSSRYPSQGASFGRARTFNLDEYVGLGKGSPQSYLHYMQRRLFSKVDIKPQNANVPNGNSKDLKIEAAKYELAISKCGGIDLQYLGIGTNGHIGFNEPGTPFSSRTHVVRLSRATLKQNLIYFKKGAMPSHAITMGIGTILGSRKIIAIATGSSKAGIVKKILTCKPSRALPASALMRRRSVVFMLDAKAAALIS